MQGKFKESIAILQKGISFDPKNPDLHANLGYSFSKIGDWASAIEHYRITLELNPDHTRTRYNLRQAMQHVTK